MLIASLAVSVAGFGARADADSSNSGSGIKVVPTGLIPLYPKNYDCSPLTSLYASWIDIDGTKRDEQHTGVDGGRIGEWILAPAPGEVRAVWRSNWGWGWEGSLIIKHTRDEAGADEDASFYYSALDHLNYDEIKHFKVGERIGRGQRLGRVHRPGGVSDYLPEVHWEVWESKNDNIKWLTNEYGALTWFIPKAQLVDPLAMLQITSDSSETDKKVKIVPFTECEARGECRGFTYILPCKKKF